MSAKSLEGAGDYYIGLGERRSYETVAVQFGVSRRTIASCAARELWNTRATEHDRQVRERAMERATRRYLAEHQRKADAFAAAWRERDERRYACLNTYLPSSCIEALEVIQLGMHVERLALVGAFEECTALLDMLAESVERKQQRQPPRAEQPRE